MKSLSIFFNTDLSLVLRDVVSVALLLVLVGALLLVVGRALLLLLRLVVGLEDGLALGLVPVVSEPGVIMIFLDQRYSLDSLDSPDFNGDSSMEI